MTMRTPLSKVKGLGSAKNGTKHHIHQRVTALFNIPLIAIFMFLMVIITVSPMQDVSLMIVHPFTVLASILFVVNVFYHACLGLQLVAEDYISNKCKLTATLIAIKAFCYVTMLAWVIAFCNLYFFFRSKIYE